MMFNRSILIALAVTITTRSACYTSDALSSHKSQHNIRTPPKTTCRTSPSTLRLTPRDDISDYGRQKQESELDSLMSKRLAIRKTKIANTKPDDESPLNSIDTMSDEELAEMFAKKEKGGSGGSTAEGGEGEGTEGDTADKVVADNLGVDIDALLSRDYKPDFKTKRSNKSSRGLSSGDSGGVLDDPNAEDEEREDGLFVDWTEDYDDENELHVPNRVGVSTVDWGNAKAGFVSGKLKKKERKMGKYNKADLRKAFEKLQQNGVSFIETSESYPVAEAFINKFNDEINYGNNAQGALVASTFPNPWKHALKSRSLPRRGAKAIITAAEESCDRMGISSMTLYQVQNPWYYIGGSTAMAEGMLDVVSDDHARYAGCINMSVTKLAKLQRKLRAQGEFVATNQFEFSLTNRKSMAMIAACKKMGITPLCTNVLDGGLATGKYTSTNPTGGEVSKGEGDTGPYAVRKLEKLDVLFKVQAKMCDKINGRVGDMLLKYESSQAPKINRDITTTQIAINYVKAKGGVPLVSVTNVKMANELLGCLGWDLTEEEVEELDKACKSCGL